MYTAFMNIDKKKQLKIINAALHEFGEKGYASASTNDIVKEAGISKGLLFHYFTNKKQLYAFLYDYSMELLMDEFFGELDQLERDIFLKLRQLILLKWKLIEKHPAIFTFLWKAALEDSIEIQNKNNDMLQTSYAKIFEDIDVTKFKKGWDFEKVKNIIMWTLQGFSDQMLEKINHLSLEEIDYAAITEELDSYIDMLREAMYSEPSTL